VLGVDYSEPNRLVRRRMFRGPRVKEGTQASGRPTPSPFASRPGRSARHRAYRLAVARAELPELAPHMTEAMQARVVAVVAQRLAVALAVMPQVCPKPGSEGEAAC
jgi:hypothetical protein